MARNKSRRRRSRKRRKSRRMKGGAPEKLYGDGPQPALGGERGRLFNEGWMGDGHKIVQKKIDEIIDDCCGDFQAADDRIRVDFEAALRGLGVRQRVLERRVNHLERQDGGNGGGNGGGGGTWDPDVDADLERRMARLARAPPVGDEYVAQPRYGGVPIVMPWLLPTARALGENPAGERGQITPSDRPRFFYTEEQQFRLGVDEAGNPRQAADEDGGGAAANQGGGRKTRRRKSRRKRRRKTRRRRKRHR